MLSRHDLTEWVKRGESVVDRCGTGEALQRARADLANHPPPSALLAYTPAPWLPIASGLPQPASGEHSNTRSKVCIATPDIVGPIRNGGVGTAYTSLARALAKAGHDVTILYTL